MSSFLEVIGWMVLVTFGLSCTGAWGMFAFNCLGQYNIGGVPNKIGAKIGVFVGLAVLALGWYWIAHIAPFTISMDK